MLQEQFKRFSCTSLRLNLRSRTIDMSPPTTTTADNSNIFTQTTSSIRVDRCYFLLIHLLFYIIIFIIVYVRLGQANNKQEKLLTALTANHDLTFTNKLQSRLLDHNYKNIDCSCQRIPHPKQNRTTRCLELRVGLTETITNVFCPKSRVNHEHNQWLIIQNRQSNEINFNRSWIEYRRGFGNILNQTDFWIGNENLYWLTNNYQCRLKIELTDWHNETRIGTYELFHISDQNNDYRIQIDGYNGDIEAANKIDSFSRWHYNAPFSTYDHYAKDQINCPNLYGGGGWWYHSGVECAHVQLNGILPTHSDGLVPLNKGISWIGWKVDRHYSFQHVRMSIQPKLKRAGFRP